MIKENEKRIEILDTTLRDGEQTSGVSFVPHEKLMIARMLLQDVNVDRVEVASARVSEGEKEAVKGICRWASRAGKLDRVEVLGLWMGICRLTGSTNVVARSSTCFARVRSVIASTS